MVQGRPDGEELGLQEEKPLSPFLDWKCHSAPALRSLRECGQGPPPPRGRLSHLRPEALPHCSPAEGLKDITQRVISPYTPPRGYPEPGGDFPLGCHPPNRCPGPHLNPKILGPSFLYCSTKASQNFQPGGCRTDETTLFPALAEQKTPPRG